MSCEDSIDLMDRALDGTLEPGLASQFRQHLAECGPCGTWFEQLRLTREGLRQLPRSGATSTARARLIEEFRKTLGPDSERS